jgi:hypothetical protein
LSLAEPRPARFLEPVDLLHQQKNRERHDKEVHDRVQEYSIRNHRSACLLGGVQSRVRLIVKRNEQIFEIQAAGQKTDRRHDDIRHQRVDNRPEGGTYDNADRQVNHIAAHRKLFKFLEHF